MLPFHVLPSRLHGSQPRIPRRQTTRGKKLLDSLETAREFRVGPRKARLRVELQFAREVRKGEEHIAQLVFKTIGIGRRKLRLKFTNLFIEFRKNRLGIRPVEADTSRALGEFLRPCERREIGGNAGQNARLPSFGRLACFPEISRHIRCASEHMRVAAHHFVGNGFRYVSKVKEPSFFAKPRMIHDLEQKIAQFVRQRIVVLAGDRVGDFVGFLDRVGG